MIPNGFIQDMISRLDIVEIVGRHVELKKAGINHKGLCPFHGEKSPSFIVSPTRQTYHCFGCGVHGDALRFTMEHSGLGFIDAVHDLAQQAGMQVPQDDASPEDKARQSALKQQQASLSDMLSRAADHYRAQLKASPRAVDYLKGRGLTGQIAAQFGLGFAPDGWRGLASVFPRYDDPMLAEAGLVVVQGEDEADQKRYDRFRDRIMFPIRSVQGDVIGFGGRVLDKGEPKYLNSPETPVFSKGRELYGLHEARHALREKGFVLVVEGYMDVVALAQLGFANAVATLGTACTAEHVQKLFRFTESVVFSFDGDAAGRRAAGRALEASLAYATDTRSVRFLFLPTEHDPDSFVREFGADAFERCIAEAVPLSRQLVETARDGCDMSAAEGRARMLAQAKPMWQALPDGALRRQILGDLATQGAIPVDELMGLWRAAPAVSRPAGASAGGDNPKPRSSRAVSGSRRLVTGTPNLLDRALWLLVGRSELWNELDAPSHDLLAEQPAPYGTAFAWLERHVNEHGAEGSEALMLQLQQEDLGSGGEALCSRITGFHANDAEVDPKQQLAIVLNNLHIQAVKDEQNLLVETGLSDPEMMARYRELGELQKQFDDLIRKLNTGP